MVHLRAGLALADIIRNLLLLVRCSASSSGIRLERHADFMTAKGFAS